MVHLSPASNLDPGPRWLVIGGASGSVLYEITPDGKVWLSPSLDLTQLKALPVPVLMVMRELINTALYDRERGR